MSAGHDDAGSFSVALEIELDQEWERRLVWAFVCAAYACTTRGSQDQPESDEADALCRAWLKLEDLSPMFSGRLVVCHDSGLMRPWFAAWEFGHSGEAWNVVLDGAGSNQLRRGPADPWISPVGSGNVRDWLLGGKPQDRDGIDFGAALVAMAKPVSFSVPSLIAGSGVVPESLRELAPGLSAAEHGGRSFSFGYVLASVLRRGLVLTDNRRLPMRTRFTSDELSEPSELRDGSGVAAVLYALKNGDAGEQERFSQVQAAFRYLTGQALDLRARHIPRHEDGGMVIEPVVVHGGSQRPVEFCGAGVQEAVLLSVLLDHAAGKVIVLDEPAVNLEPTVQRRLLRQLRGPGQCIVITHHADLVPVDDPADLARVVRVAPGESGSQVQRPSLGKQRPADARRWLRLMEPAHVRGLLFAPAVILCEGATEAGALPLWWRLANRIGLRDPESANIPLIGVGGHKGYGGYVRFLDAFSIPWAIITDGPALRCDSAMSKQLADLGHHRPDLAPADRDDFAGWRKYWEGAGVFTVAAKFGDDGCKGGEFEALLERTDKDLLEVIRREVGRGGKPIVGSWFAEEHPEPPGEVLELYQKIAGHLGPKLIPPAKATSRVPD